MKRLYYCLILALVMPLFACGSNNEQGIKDSRTDFMVDLQAELTKNKIPFRVDDEGYIRFANEHKDVVEDLKRQIDARRLGEVGSKFDDEQSTEYLRNLLNEMGKKYRAVKREDGEWTFWNPESKEQQEEVEMKVVTRTFERQKGVRNNAH